MEWAECNMAEGYWLTPRECVYLMVKLAEDQGSPVDEAWSPGDVEWHLAYLRGVLQDQECRVG